MEPRTWNNLTMVTSQGFPHKAIKSINMCIYISIYIHDFHLRVKIINHIVSVVDMTLAVTLKSIETHKLFGTSIHR